MRSMTGYGKGSASAEGVSVTIELKTVNNRFLDVALKLGSDLQLAETRIKRLIADRLSRGRVDVNLQFERTAEVTFELNRPLLSGFLNAMQEIRDEFGISGEPDINVVARLPNVMNPKKEAIDDVFMKCIESAIAVALSDLEAMRGNEGSMLKEELASRLNAIESLLVPIASESASVAEEYQQKLSRRITEMLSRSEIQIELDESRLAQEIAYIADRSDISEEIARLQSHLAHFRQIMDEEKEVGKRLDFLTQELNREANTITSKTNSLVVKENALKVKSEIEKIREQVQNIE
ncbi:MAG TPA: YicC family protein [Pyrinomonadaceae bacterium]|nr:YicC family protein [Pyrinomonadaceae bacterium]